MLPTHSESGRRGVDVLNPLTSSIAMSFAFVLIFALLQLISTM